MKKAVTMRYQPMMEGGNGLIGRVLTIHRSQFSSCSSTHLLLFLDMQCLLCQASDGVCNCQELVPLGIWPSRAAGNPSLQQPQRQPSQPVPASGPPPPQPRQRQPSQPVPASNPPPSQPQQPQLSQPVLAAGPISSQPPQRQPSQPVLAGNVSGIACSAQQPSLCLPAPQPQHTAAPSSCALAAAPSASRAPAAAGAPQQPPRSGQPAAVPGRAEPGPSRHSGGAPPPAQSKVAGEVKNGAAVQPPRWGSVRPRTSNPQAPGMQGSATAQSQPQPQLPASSSAPGPAVSRAQPPGSHGQVVGLHVQHQQALSGVPLVAVHGPGLIPALRWEKTP